MENQPKPLKTYKNQHGTMKNQSGTIKNNLELYRVVMGGSDGYRRLPGGSVDFWWQTDTCTIIYISSSCGSNVPPLHLHQFLTVMCANFRAEDCMNISARSLQDFITTVQHPPSLLQCWQRVCSPRWGGGRGLGVIIAGLVRLRRDQGWFRGRLGRSVTELHKMQQ